MRVGMGHGAEEAEGQRCGGAEEKEVVQKLSSAPLPPCLPCSPAPPPLLLPDIYPFE